MFTPVPAKQIDSNQTAASTTGYFVARSDLLPASALTIYEVSKGTNGTMNLSAARGQHGPGLQELLQETAPRYPVGLEGRLRRQRAGADQISPASLNDFTCSLAPCRWGDYPAAILDPAAPSPPTGNHGQVWLTNQWAKTSSSRPATGWGS